MASLYTIVIKLGEYDRRKRRNGSQRAQKNALTDSVKNMGSGSDYRSGGDHQTLWCCVE